ncbi:tRNA 5-methylaminomethyl-2-thiouridine biosynthesis bifunctional protein MnmC [Arenibacter antarcticus]|uniref:NAD(P)/FAD-dependent oxidoreductase n=1 Tax=Arenibacter antarcticus TaxID=2040469 RepID=A0ABW5VJK9_9FLAO|nr:FAD-dependent oxidoreductase [Arenibacter sp. H213]MCM4166971.1 FAD-dependent oxidoreductase [Arenibacter sp. H213]
MVDYLVVGMGLAGISFCEVLEKNNKSFIAISDSSQISSVVAGGLYNPVILKRFTLAWNVKEQLEMAMPFYRDLELKLNSRLLYKLPVLRRFNSIEEQNLWFEAADKPNLKPFLSPDLIFNDNMHIEAPFGYGEVLGTGRLDTANLVDAYKRSLLDKKLLVPETFNFEELNIDSSHVEYKSIVAKQIVFATGFGLRVNPYFNYLPLNGTKGELLTVKAPLLKESNVIKSSVFIIPMGTDLYRVGATYNREDKTNVPTDAAKTELLKKLNSFIRCPYEVVDHVAGVRPTVQDRRPLVGRHPQHANLYALNGFGSRGVIVAPAAAQQLYDLVENNKPIEKEMDISRYANKS